MFKREREQAALPSKDEQVGGEHENLLALPVALKLMRSRGALKREIEYRGGYRKEGPCGGETVRCLLSLFPHLFLLLLLHLLLSRKEIP